MTPEQLATWRQLADAATPEGWSVEETCGDTTSVLFWNDDEKYYDSLAIKVSQADAAFIAAAREAVPALLDTVAERDAEIARLSTALYDEAAKQLGDAALENMQLRAAVEQFRAKWSAEHDEAVRLDERLKMAQAELANAKQEVLELLEDMGEVSRL